MYKIEFISEGCAYYAADSLRTIGARVKQMRRAVLVDNVHPNKMADIMVQYRGYTVDPNPDDSLE